MPRPGPATQSKRNRERSLQDRKREKDERRARRKETRLNKEPLTADGVDPQIADIRPGPQPPTVD